MGKIFMKHWIIIFLISVTLTEGCISLHSSSEIVTHLFDTPWEDRGLFYKGIVSSEQEILNELPNATVYHIDLSISEDYLSLSGHEDVFYTNQEFHSLKKVYFRLFPNITGGKIFVTNMKINSQKIEPFYEFQNSALCILLPSLLKPGESIIFHMDFDVELPREQKSNYGLFGYFNDVLTLNDFYPVISVYDERGWNVEIPPPYGDMTYLDMSFYLVRVKAPKKLKLVTSGIEIGRINSGKYQITAFAAGPVRDFYIAGSEKYTVLTLKTGETTVKSYTFLEDLSGGEKAIEFAANALDCYSRRFGAYPYTEFDIVSTPIDVMGMEYPGIIAVAIRLYNPKNLIENSSYDILETVVAHETAHQWFYNIVGNDQLNEPWLDESVVQYITYLYYKDLHGDIPAENYSTSWKVLWDLTEKDKIPIGLPSKSYTKLSYVSIIYGRGPLFVRTLAEKMGEEAFDEFLCDYYNSYKWKIAKGDDFRRIAEEHCHCDLSILFEMWVYNN